MLTLIKNLVAILKAHFGITSIKSQKGVTMVEYALVTALIVVVALAAFGTNGDLKAGLDAVFGDIKTELDGAISD